MGVVTSKDAPRGLKLLVAVLYCCAFAGTLYSLRSAPSHERIWHALTFPICAPVVWFLYRGHQWARVVVLFIAVVVAIPYGLLTLSGNAPWYRVFTDPEAALAVVEGGIGAVAAVYLFFPRVRSYFGLKEPIWAI